MNLIISRVDLLRGKMKANEEGIKIIQNVSECNRKLVIIINLFEQFLTLAVIA
jgi:hypothetical protein